MSREPATIVVNGALLQLASSGDDSSELRRKLSLTRTTFYRWEVEVRPAWAERGEEAQAARG